MRQRGRKASHGSPPGQAGGPPRLDTRRQQGAAHANTRIHSAFPVPEARGAAARMLQKRLPQELRSRGITTMDQANRFLKEVRIPAHNARFVLCWSGAPEDDAAGSVRESLCLHADRIVGNDNTVRYKRLTLQIPPDGTLAVFHDPRCLAHDQGNAEPIETPTSKAPEPASPTEADNRQGTSTRHIACSQHHDARVGMLFPTKTSPLLATVRPEG